MKNWISSIVNDEDGATMVEYGIMLAMIAGVCVVVVGSVGSKTLGLYSGTKIAMNQMP